jgi:uncharacterized protein involved in exopolysaccharide biosynthesis
MRAFEETKRLIQAAHRRRKLILLPVFMLLAVSLAIALLTPQRFQARSLALFQEVEVENPLARNPVAITERMQDRIAGFRALIRSDAVLGPVIDGEMNAAATALPRAEQVRLLRDAISVESVGNNLIEFRLLGSPAAGLGSRLDRVMASFLNTYRQVAPQRAGARLQMIDAPRDPDRPATGRSVIVISGLLAGAILGLLLAVVAETLDQRVRTFADLRHIADQTAVIRLARLKQPPSTKPTSVLPKFLTPRKLIAAVVPIVLVAAGYVMTKTESFSASAKQIVDKLRHSDSPVQLNLSKGNRSRVDDK